MKTTSKISIGNMGRFWDLYLALCGATKNLNDFNNYDNCE